MKITLKKEEEEDGEINKALNHGGQVWPIRFYKIVKSEYLFSHYKAAWLQNGCRKVKIQNKRITVDQRVIDL